MNTKYFDTLPEVSNQYNVDLEDNEKVVFAAELSTFGTEKDRVLGSPGSSDFTLTNKRIIANNGVGVWTVDLSDIVRCVKVESGKFIFKSVYFAVDLKMEMEYDYGKQRLTGFHFYFKKDATAKFEEIINNLFN